MNCKVMALQNGKARHVCIAETEFMQYAEDTAIRCAKNPLFASIYISVEEDGRRKRIDIKTPSTEEFQMIKGWRVVWIATNSANIPVAKFKKPEIAAVYAAKNDYGLHMQLYKPDWPLKTED